MRITPPVSDGQTLPYNVVKIFGCSDTTVGFQILSEVPTVGKRRYCNKVLVHECVTVPELEPLALSRVEFLSTDDSCYKYFNLFKSSDDIGTIASTIDLQLNVDELVIGILVNFTKAETCCLPLRMAYRINAYDEDNVRINLAQGNLYVSPSNSQSTCTSGCGDNLWVDVDW